MRTEHITSNTLAAPRFALSENVARNVTMSSREIAELTGASHDNVLKTVRALVAKGVVSGNETPYIHPQNGQTYTEFRLSYRDTMVVVSGYSVELRARIIDRWQELEAQQQPRIPQSLSEALRLAADQAEQIEAQQQALAIAAPKAEFVDRYVVADGSMSFRQVAKLLSANERKFRQMLLDKGVMYYLGGVLTPYQQHIDAGRFEVKTGTSERNQHAFTQARFTPKGLQWVAGLWAAQQMEQQV